MYKLSHLEKLHNDMLSKDEDRDIFPFSYNGKDFSCIFLSDILPYRLYVTALGNNSMSFEFEVNNNYEVKTFIDKYKELVAYLGIQYDPNYTFKPIDFFEQLNSKIPEHFTRRPKYKDVLRIRSGHKVEKAGEENFCGWRKSPTGRVSKENLEKTRRAFGDKYAEMSLKKGISSCWTADDDKENLKLLNDILAMA